MYMAELFATQERKRKVSEIISLVRKATAQNKVLSMERLKAIGSIELGATPRKIGEYIKELNNAGYLKVDGDDIIALNPVTGEIFRDVEMS